uniref:Uncharacterized protein n=1 Tax=Romanomermis culicivorax TaxID=13658 RepID=A0A915HJB0_ROMCU
MRRRARFPSVWIHLYKCIEISQLRKDLTMKPNVHCIQKTMLYMQHTAPTTFPPTWISSSTNLSVEKLEICSTSNRQGLSKCGGAVLSLLVKYKSPDFWVGKLRDEKRATHPWMVYSRRKLTGGDRGNYFVVAVRRSQRTMICVCDVRTRCPDCATSRDVVHWL